MSGMYSSLSSAPRRMDPCAGQIPLSGSVVSDSTEEARGKKGLSSAVWVSLKLWNHMLPWHVLQIHLPGLS